MSFCHIHTKSFSVLLGQPRPHIECVEITSRWLQAQEDRACTEEELFQDSGLSEAEFKPAFTELINTSLLQVQEDGRLKVCTTDGPYYFCESFMILPYLGFLGTSEMLLRLAPSVLGSAAPRASGRYRRPVERLKRKLQKAADDFEKFLAVETLILSWCSTHAETVVAGYQVRLLLRMRFDSHVLRSLIRRPGFAPEKIVVNGASSLNAILEHMYRGDGDAAERTLERHLIDQARLFETLIWSSDRA